MGGNIEIDLRETRHKTVCTVFSKMWVGSF